MTTGPEPPSAIRYTLVGSGTVVPDAERGPAAHHLAVGGLRLLMDLGSGTLRKLDGLGRRFEELDLVAVTHRHQDHVADLLPLLFALRHAPGVDRVRPLTLVGYDGLANDLGRLADVYGDWVVEPGFPLEVVEAADTPVEIAREAAGVTLDAMPVVHSPEAVGYRLTLWAGDREVVLAYTGDTEECAEAVALAREADLLVAECSVADGLKAPGHLSPRALGRLAAEADVGRLVATHFYPSVLALGWGEVERRILEAWPGGRVELGYDGLVVDL